MSTSIYAFVDDTRRAHDIVHELKGLGFPIQEISVVMPESHVAPGSRTGDPEASSASGTVAGAATGSVVGGVVGWLVGAGTLALPGVGMLVAAGPALAALTGAAAGGLTGALAGMGLSQADADHSAAQLGKGRILISVATHDPDQRASVEEVFGKHGAGEGRAVETS